MNAEKLVSWIESLQRSGKVVGINTPKGGRWIGQDDKVEAREGDDCIYWEQEARTFVLPAAMCWLEAVDPMGPEQ